MPVVELGHNPPSAGQSVNARRVNCPGHGGFRNAQVFGEATHGAGAGWHPAECMRHAALPERQIWPA